MNFCVFYVDDVALAFDSFNYTLKYRISVVETCDSLKDPTNPFDKPFPILLIDRCQVYINENLFNQ